MKSTLFAGLLAALSCLIPFGRRPPSLSVPTPIPPPPMPSPAREEFTPAFTDPGNRLAVSRPFGSRGRRKVARLSPGWRWILKTHRKARPWIGTTEGGAIERAIASNRAKRAALAGFGRIPQAKAA